MRKPKILFVLKRRLSSYGISLGLVNSATFTSRALNKRGYDTEVIDVNDGNCIDREIYLNKPDIVILEALWATPDKILELARRYSKVQFIIRLHSRAAFLSGEGIALEWVGRLAHYSMVLRNIKLSTNNLEFNKDISEIFSVPFVYMPNIYEEESKKMYCKYDGHIDIGLFGAIRTLKNQFIQAMAAMRFAERHNLVLRLHINAGRVEGNADPILKNIRNLFKYACPSHRPHILIEHEWMSHRDFKKLIASMDINMQVSFDESHNIVSCDSIAGGVPLVGSKEIAFIPSVLQADTTSTDDIVRKLTTAYKFPKICVLFQKIFLWIYNYKATRAWEKYLHNWKE